MLESNPPPAVVHRLPLGHLGWLFLRIGATAFGGLGAGLALIERDLVEKRRLLTREDVTEALTTPVNMQSSLPNCIGRLE